MLIDDILATGLAIAFAYMFFIENWGSGLLRVQRALREAGLAPLGVKDFGNSIRLTVMRRTAVSDTWDNRGDNVDNRGDNADNRGDNADNRGDNLLLALPEEQRRICGMVKANPRISIRRMAEMLGVRKNTLDRQLSALKAKGVIERKNGTRGVWRVVD